MILISGSGGRSPLTMEFMLTQFMCMLHTHIGYATLVVHM